MESKKKQEFTIYNKKYKKTNYLGKGSFGSVYLVESITEDGEKPQYFSMKKFFLDKTNNKNKDQMSPVLSQFDLLKSLSHPNIVEVEEYFISKGNECIIFKHYKEDLLKIIHNKKIDLKNEKGTKIIRSIMQNIIEGVAYLHDLGIIHRDLKPENILVGGSGEIKLIDFDLARYVDNDKPMTKGVVTIYYRPPEIFLGESNYSFSADMWSVGCILAEMILQSPIFKGESELSVLFKISNVLGSADDKWPGCSELPNYMFYPNQSAITPIEDLFSGLVPEALMDLIKNLVVLDPSKRLSAKEALKHKFFEGEKASQEELIQYLFY